VLQQDKKKAQPRGIALNPPKEEGGGDKNLRLLPEALNAKFQRTAFSIQLGINFTRQNGALQDNFSDLDFKPDQFNNISVNILLING
jgi:hypothetical protein